MKPVQDGHEIGATRSGLRAMFDLIPRTYELVNHVVTLGGDIAWRTACLREAIRGTEVVCVDLCTGTGETARLLRRAAPATARVLGLDFSRRMLRHAVGRGRGEGIGWVCAAAPALPFAAETADLVTITFAVRNLRANRRALVDAFAEIRRVLRPGGRLAIVETSQPASPLLRALMHAYVRAIVPTVGALVSGEASPYRYLSRSIRCFLGAQEVAAVLGEAGFEAVVVKRLWGGIAAVHVATR